MTLMQWNLQPKEIVWSETTLKCEKIAKKSAVTSNNEEKKMSEKRY